MPPKSRKRNKGKDRKAKKLETERARVRSIWWGFTTDKNLTTQKLRSWLYIDTK